MQAASSSHSSTENATLHRSYEKDGAVIEKGEKYGVTATRRETSRAIQDVISEEFGPSGLMIVSRLSRLPVVQCGMGAYREAKAHPLLEGPLTTAELCLRAAAEPLAAAAAPFLKEHHVSVFVTDRVLCKFLEIALDVCPCIASPPSQICGEINNIISTCMRFHPEAVANDVCRNCSKAD